MYCGSLSWRILNITFLAYEMRNFQMYMNLPEYVNRELPDVQAGFRKGRGTREQIANIFWIIEKARVPKNIYFAFLIV